MELIWNELAKLQSVNDADQAKTMVLQLLNQAEQAGLL